MIYSYDFGMNITILIELVKYAIIWEMLFGIYYMSCPLNTSQIPCTLYNRQGTVFLHVEGSRLQVLGLHIKFTYCTPGSPHVIRYLLKRIIPLPVVAIVISHINIVLAVTPKVVWFARCPVGVGHWFSTSISQVPFPIVILSRDNSTTSNSGVPTA